MEEMNNNIEIYRQAVDTIKRAIVECQQLAIKKVANIQLALYYGIGRYLSQNTRVNTWGTGAIDEISSRLQREMPGLRGFSSRNLRYMRTFYEEWTTNLEITTSELDEVVWKSQFPNLSAEDIVAFSSIAFTHHTEILKYVKDRDARLYYIRQCALNSWKVETLIKHIKADDFHHQDQLPSNFAVAIPSHEQAIRAITAFKDSYLLDFINTEELGIRDPEDIDERVLEQEIVQNIKQFILTFGKDFSFIGNQYRIEAGGKEHFIDLLFYNRELQSLVAVELKAGEFKAAYLGQLHMYLQALDDYVRKPFENPSIGIILCKSAERTYVEYAVRDYDKPMGVATFRTSEEMPNNLRQALPNIEELKKLL